METVSLTKGPKFTDDQIIDMFSLVNKAVYAAGIGSGVFTPITDRNMFFDRKTGRYSITAKQFLQQLASKGKISDRKVNASGLVLAGDSYDNDNDVSRQKKAEQKAFAAVDAANDALAKSGDPLFSRLTCIMKSIDFPICVTRKDYGDDGNDSFGMQFYVKFSYLK